METVQEFRGVDCLSYAPLVSDTIEKYETGVVKMLAPVAEISKTTATASDTKYYNNIASLTINAEGADTITVTIPALDLKTYAELLGKEIDKETGALMDGNATPVYFALGYILNKTDGTNRYVWRYKCSASIPEESSATQNAGTDTKNQQLTITGISTIDPVGGYVMIPCIERNAVGVLRSIDAAILAEGISDLRKHKVSFDMVVNTMNYTGRKIPIDQGKCNDIRCPGRLSG